MHNERLAYWFLVMMDVFVALVAGVTGVLLAAGALSFPLAWLGGTPFTSYAVPGLLLASVVGGSALAAAVAMARDHRWGPRLSLLAGAILVAWTAGQLVLLGQPMTGNELFYLAVGGLMMAVSLVVPSLHDTDDTSVLHLG